MSNKLFTKESNYNTINMKLEGGEMMKLTLKALRVNAGFTLKKASEQLGISVVTLISYETKKTIPNVEMLDKMLELYNVKFSKFNYSAKDNALIIV